MVILYDHVIARFDDSFQPTGVIHWGKSGGLAPAPIPHVEMKKLHHELRLAISGPAGSDVSNCVQDAAVVRLISAVVGAYTNGGDGVAQAEGAFVTALEGCLGPEFAAQLHDQSHWVTWDA